MNFQLKKISEKTKKFRGIKDIPDLDSMNISTLFANENAFGKKILPKILFLKSIISEINNKPIRNLFSLSLYSILVEISNYRRGPDLALKHKKLITSPVFEKFFEKSSYTIDDLKNIDKSNFLKPKVFTGDSRYLKKIEDETINLVMTSPPYLNGTNYFRNTKLELWLSGMLSTSDQLHEFREKAVTAGICDVFKSKKCKTDIPIVQDIVESMEKIAYDSRIPAMISIYFKDISVCLQNLYRVMKKNGKCHWVVGDSAFSKILVPTDPITVSIAEKIGFTHEKTEIVRKRKSRSGFLLHEAVITLKKN